MICFICKLKNNKAFLRILLYKFACRFVIEDPDLVTKLFLTVARIWPKALYWSESSKNEISRKAILGVIISILNELECRLNRAKSKLIKSSTIYVIISG